MPNLAVVLHIHYIDMWHELRGYLENICNVPYDLYVTLTAENPDLEAKIKAFKPDVMIWVVENRGYDVGAFIDFLQKVNLLDYSCVLKLHTKNSTGKQITKLNKRNITRQWWKILLIESLVGTQKGWLRNFKEISSEKKLGMIGSKYLLVADKKSSEAVYSEVCVEMKKLGFEQPKKICFVAGTMFLIRANILQVLKDNYKLSDFMPTDVQIKDKTLAHVLERLFGAVTEAQGYKIKGFDSNKKFVFDCFYHAVILRIFRFFYQRKETKQGYILFKICKIPVCHKKTVK